MSILMEKLETLRVLVRDLCDARNQIDNGLSLLSGTLNDARMYSEKDKLPGDTGSLCLEFEKKFSDAEPRIALGLSELGRLIEAINGIGCTYTEPEK